ncbi:MAG: YtxH domain-containing protein [Saprospiraceae bacterium]|jgi:gas vesicle protein|nr:YtxH domain-containing protein [Saprospiraceae bacterium]
MGRGNVILGILGGVAVGALLGVLLAPDKGERTRKKILRKGEDYVDAMKDKLDDFVEDMNQKMEGMAKEAANALRRNKVRANAMVDEVVDKI